MKKLIQLILILCFSSFYAQDKSCFEIARNGSLSEIKLLYEKDKNIINAIDEKGFSMLILACYLGNPDVFHFILEQDVDVNYVSPSGTALMACVFKNKVELVDLILEKGADPDLTDTNGLTALMLAVQLNNVVMVEKLLNVGANKKLKCNQNKTAFEYAVFLNNSEIINKLK